MNLKKTLAGVAPFAHLLSRAAAPVATRAEENERDQREGESDDDYAQRMKDLDEKEKAGKKADRDGNDVDGDDANADDDGDDETDDAKKAARATERARCARIMARGIAMGAPEQAAVFAFNTKLSSHAAIAALDAAKAIAPTSAPAAARRPSLDERMSHARPSNPGGSAPAAPEPTLAEKILAAGKMRRGES